MVFYPVFQGIILGLGMIIPIGAQNAFVLNQGIKRNYHVTTATICIVSDFMLIVLGVYGSGELIKQNNQLLTLITWAGIIFLFVYGFLSFKSIFNQAENTHDCLNKPKSLYQVVLATLAVTLLNPHVYLDTVVILGSVGSQFVGNSRLFFIIGCMFASVIWFYSLSLGAAKLSPILSRKKARQIIDLFVGIIMWLIAFCLFNNWLEQSRLN